MEKYIKLKDINELIEKLMKEPAYQHEYENFYCGVGAVADRLLGISTVQLEESKEGKWIERIEKPTWLEDDVEVYYDCSCCGTHNFDTTPYCPICGAKMSFEETA